MQEIKVNIENGVKTLEVRQGEALPVREPKRIDISGRLDTVSRFIVNRVNDLEINHCHCIVNREEKTLHLKIDEASYFNGTIVGKLEFSPIYESLNLNTGISWTREELAKFIKENRVIFESQSNAMVLASQLLKFEAKVEKQLRDNKDTRGNTESFKRQVVESNLPESFIVNIPIFKGEEPRQIEISIEINPNSLNAMLVSYDANDIIKKFSDKLFDDELNIINEATDNKLLIVEM